MIKYERDFTLIAKIVPMVDIIKHSSGAKKIPNIPINANIEYIIPLLVGPSKTLATKRDIIITIVTIIGINKNVFASLY